jgi:electron transfer flavoprotein alpha subunit
MGREILVVVELDGQGAPTAESLSLVTFAKSLGQATGTTLSLLVATDATAARPQELLHLGATRVYCLTLAARVMSWSEPLLAGVCAVLAQGNFGFVIGNSNDFGNDLLPRIAARSQAALIAHCIGFDTHDQRVTFLRPTLGGAAVAACEAASALVALTVHSSRFHRAPIIDEQASELCPVAAPMAVRERITCLSWESHASIRPPLETATVVVAGGRPLGSKFHELLNPLADELGAALGATRALCDTGLVGTDLQVGLTGRTIAPSVYLAIGISGSAQHLAGIRNAKTIVAINQDSTAPIFEVASYGMVGDLWTIVPSLVDAIRNQRRAMALSVPNARTDGCGIGH